jgi:hypothetical protein
MAPYRGDAPYPHTFPSKKQAALASRQGDSNTSVPHQPVATKAHQQPAPFIGQGEAAGLANRQWAVPVVNWGSHGRIRWGQLINAPQARFRQVVDYLGMRGHLQPIGVTPRPRRTNHAALDEPSYNLGQINEGDIVALARARQAARQKRGR